MRSRIFDVLYALENDVPWSQKHEASIMEGSRGEFAEGDGRNRLNVMEKPTFESPLWNKKWWLTLKTMPPLAEEAEMAAKWCLIHVVWMFVD